MGLAIIAMAVVVKRLLTPTYLSLIQFYLDNDVAIIAILLHM